MSEVLLNGATARVNEEGARANGYRFEVRSFPHNQLHRPAKEKNRAPKDLRNLTGPISTMPLLSSLSAPLLVVMGWSRRQTTFTTSTSPGETTWLTKHLSSAQHEQL